MTEAISKDLVLFLGIQGVYDNYKQQKAVANCVACGRW